MEIIRTQLVPTRREKDDYVEFHIKQKNSPAEAGLSKQTIFKSTFPQT